MMIPLRFSVSVCLGAEGWGLLDEIADQIKSRKAARGATVTLESACRWCLRVELVQWIRDGGNEQEPYVVDVEPKTFV